MVIGKTLVRRLEHLEYRLPPEGEPLVIQVRFISPDGTSTDGPIVTFPGHREHLPRDWRRRGRKP